MNRIPRTVRIAVAVVLLAFGVLGVTNSQHLAAKFTYAVLIALASAAITHAGVRRSG